MDQPAIKPDTKDWTWVLQRSCAECGLDPSRVHGEDLPGRIRINAQHWAAVLTGRTDVRERPQATKWSPLEYACHVRDVHRIFADRVRLMVESADPQFENWDQDATAVDERYGQQDPATVAAELVAGAEAVASRFAAVPADAWQRSGRRSDGSVFTVESIGQYHLHDIEHHMYDVTGSRGP